MAAKRASPKAKSDDVFGQAWKAAKMFRAGLYVLHLQERSADVSNAEPQRYGSMPPNEIETAGMIPPTLGP